MAKKKRRSKSARKIPTVRIARPKGRPFQLRYKCPIEDREIRISVGSRDEDEAKQMKAELEAKFILGLETNPSYPSMEWAIRVRFETVGFD